MCTFKDVTSTYNWKFASSHKNIPENKKYKYINLFLNIETSTFLADSQSLGHYDYYFKINK